MLEVAYDGIASCPEKMAIILVAGTKLLALLGHVSLYTAGLSIRAVTRSICYS